MREILKFQRKNGEFKYMSTKREWVTEQGLHYICYPFMIYKEDNRWKLTHLSSGALVCNTACLYGAKYIATRLIPVPQFLLPTDKLANHMTEQQRRFCTDILDRYRDERKERILFLDKNCPYAI